MNLPWASALAADVYAWAKQENLPVIDNGVGKFVTDIAWDVAQNSLVVSRSDIDWNDIKNAPDFGVLTVEAADTSLEITPTTGDVKAKAKLSVAEGNILRLENDGLYVPAPDEVTLPSYEDNAVALSFVAEVDQANGKIATSKAALVQGANITLTQDAAGEDITIAGKDWSDEIATALADAKKYADDNDANDNTAHTHTAGNGLKLTGNGGIDGVVDYSLNLALKLENGNIILHDKDDATKVIATLEANELLEDSYLNDVEIVGNELQFTWKMDDGSTKTDKVDLAHLVDVYSGENEGTIKVEVDNYKISAEVIEGTLKDSHIATDAAIAETKLAQGVQDALGLARTALQSVEHPDYTDEFAGKKDKQNTYSAEGSTGKTITKVEQNENGEVTVTYDDIAFPVPPVVNDGKFTVSGTGALTGTGFMTANQADDTTATLDVADKGITTAKIADKAVGAEQTKAYAGAEKIETEEVWVFYCGTSDFLV